MSSSRFLVLPTLGAALLAFGLGCSGLLPEVPEPQGPVITPEPGTPPEAAAQQLYTACRDLLMAGDTHALDCLAPGGSISFLSDVDGSRTDVNLDSEMLRTSWTMLRMTGMSNTEPLENLPSELPFVVNDGVASTGVDVTEDGVHVALSIEASAQPDGSWAFTTVNLTIEDAPEAPPAAP